MGNEAVTHMVRTETTLRTKVSVRVAGRSGAEEDVVRRGALIEVDGVRPGVRYGALETMGEALIELHGQTVVVAETRIIDLCDLPVFGIDASAIRGGGVRSDVSARRILNRVGDGCAQGADTESAATIE